MNVIEHLYNFYSKGDMIQPLFGFFHRTLPAHERIANCMITIKSKSSQTFDPSHTQLHCPLIAQWMLAIPTRLSQAKSGNFENFFHGDGEIRFVEGKNPLYRQKLKKLRGSIAAYSTRPDQSN